jgi:hypothetical protein
MKTLSLQAPSFDGFDGGAGMCHIAVRCRQARDPSLRYRLTIPEIGRRAVEKREKRAQVTPGVDNGIVRMSCR